MDLGDAISTCDPHPNAMILCYPVISFGPFAHELSMTNLLGQTPPLELRERLSAQLNVSALTPPAFVWQTVEDQKVPVENSMLFAQALSEQHVPFELHIFPRGLHGLGLEKDDPYVAQWKSLCATWLKARGF